MALFAAEAMTWITDTIGGETQESNKQTLNDAGEHLVAMHRWRWLQREGTVSTVADQDYASLPADFMSSLEINEAASFSGFGLTSFQGLSALKSSGFQGDTVFVGTVTYRNIASVITPVLRLDPTPSVTASDVFNIAYLAGWTVLADDRDTILIPLWMRNLYRQLVVAFARGHDEDDETRVAPAGQLIEEHLAIIEQGRTFKAAVNRDAMINPTIGQPRRGWMETQSSRYAGVSGNSFLRNAPGSPSV